MLILWSLVCFVGVPAWPVTFGRQAVARQAAITQIPEYFKVFKALRRTNKTPNWWCNVESWLIIRSIPVV